MGIVEVSGIAFTTFQLSGVAYRWWQAYEEGRPADGTPPTWAQFEEIFLKEFVPQTLRDAWRTKFDWLCQGTMTMSEYTFRFSELSRHAPILVPTVRERVCRFIEGLDYDFKISMARELQIDIPFQQVVEITRMLERVRSKENKSKEIKRSRNSRGFSGFYYATMTHHGGGSDSRSAQSAIQSPSATIEAERRTKIRNDPMKQGQNEKSLKKSTLPGVEKRRKLRDDASGSKGKEVAKGSSSETHNGKMYLYVFNKGIH
ncbi:uncharacterized protein [Nicotiana tomentosiformis]|uniref:uncharacterized protein n=1 Tax=Nicotiana tomentosiformis TaxID=4098 RepID=UPI00388CAA65